jgi:hypothetical protein
MLPLDRRRPPALARAYDSPPIARSPPSSPLPSPMAMSARSTARSAISSRGSAVPRPLRPQLHPRPIRSLARRPVSPLQYRSRLRRPPPHPRPDAPAGRIHRGLLERRATWRRPRSRWPVRAGRFIDAAASARPRALLPRRCACGPPPPCATSCPTSPAPAPASDSSSSSDGSFAPTTAWTSASGAASLRRELQYPSTPTSCASAATSAPRTAAMPPPNPRRNHGLLPRTRSSDPVRFDFSLCRLGIEKFCPSRHGTPRPANLRAAPRLPASCLHDLAGPIAAKPRPPQAHRSAREAPRVVVPCAPPPEPPPVPPFFSWPVRPPFVRYSASIPRCQGFG